MPNNKKCRNLKFKSSRGPRQRLSGRHGGRNRPAGEGGSITDPFTPGHYGPAGQPTLGSMTDSPTPGHDGPARQPTLGNPDFWGSSGGVPLGHPGQSQTGRHTTCTGGTLQEEGGGQAVGQASIVHPPEPAPAYPQHAEDHSQGSGVLPWPCYQHGPPHTPRPYSPHVPKPVASSCSSAGDSAGVGGGQGLHTPELRTVPQDSHSESAGLGKEHKSEAEDEVEAASPQKSDLLDAGLISWKTELKCKRQQIRERLEKARAKRDRAQAQLTLTQLQVSDLEYQLESVGSSLSMCRRELRLRERQIHGDQVEAEQEEEEEVDEGQPAEAPVERKRKRSKKPAMIIKEEEAEEEEAVPEAEQDSAEPPRKKKKKAQALLPPKEEEEVAALPQQPRKKKVKIQHAPEQDTPMSEQESEAEAPAPAPAPRTPKGSRAPRTPRTARLTPQDPPAEDAAGGAGGPAGHTRARVLVVGVPRQVAVRSGSLSCIEKLSSRKPSALAFNPSDPDELAVSTDACVVVKWKWRQKRHTLETSGVYPGVAPLLPAVLEWHPTGAHMAMAHTRGAEKGEEPDPGQPSSPTVTLFNCETGKIKLRHVSGEVPAKKSFKALLSAGWLPDTDHLVTGGEDHRVRLWKNLTAKGFQKRAQRDLVTLHDLHTAGVKTLCCPQGADTVISGGLDGRIICWSLDRSAVSWHVDRARCDIPRVNSVLCVPGMQHVFMISRVASNYHKMSLVDDRCPLEFGRNTCYQWEKQMLTYSMHIQPRMAPSGYLFSCGSTRPEVHLWDIRSSQPQPMQTLDARLAGHEGRVFTATFHPTEGVNALFTMGVDRAVGVLNFHYL